MAFGKLSDEGDVQPLSEINMIPMIDVMLVLLIVFMITAPLLTNAVKLELPEASSQLNQPDKQEINLAIDGAGKIYWNDQEVDEAALLARMESAGQTEGELPEIQLHIDRKVEYGIIARVMAQASQHGLHKIAFVSQPEP
ncbi:ExbD/TolR family protein [Aeromonas dhakensis]|uniref:ExbD/TolR family protein n=1 Tax=Aeromonas dhakensis TaxID=196024 RepID=UPI001BFC0815|nr:biopolymer transporter ExbD [Aeromonas dhakensis]HDT5890107.1 biopolymer transporter ExbD [Aeromonas dhakensis]HEB4977555.1 biopolymer transporter ExbD [Aeromonas dhakensis]